MTTIQTIKEAEKKFDEKLNNKAIEDEVYTDAGYGCMECGGGLRTDFVKSFIIQTLLAVFESELENLPYAGNETHTEQQIVDDENYPQEERGVVTERLRIRSHLIEVINHLKQK